MSDVKARMRRVLDVKIRQLNVRLADNGDAARHAVENDDVDRGAALQRHLFAVVDKGQPIISVLFVRMPRASGSSQLQKWTPSAFVSLTTASMTAGRTESHISSPAPTAPRSTNRSQRGRTARYMAKASRGEPRFAGIGSNVART